MTAFITDTNETLKVIKKPDAKSTGPKISRATSSFEQKLPNKEKDDDIEDQIPSYSKIA